MSVEDLPVPLIATASYDNNIVVHRDGKTPQALGAHSNYVWGLSFCPTNANVLASASDDKSVIIWDLEQSCKIKTLSDLSTPPRSVSWSCDGKYVAAACRDNRSYVFDTRNDYKQLCVLGGHTDCVATGHTIYVDSTIFHSTDPAMCATVSQDNTVKVWRLSSVSKPECLMVLKHSTGVLCICWLSDGRYLVSGSMDMLRLWNVEDGTEVAKFVGHSSGLWSVAVSPDARMIASGSTDNTCRIWEAESGGKMLHVLEHPNAVNCIAFTSDGLRVITGCFDAKIRVWNVAVGKVVAMLGSQFSPRCLALPPANCQAVADNATCAAGQHEHRCCNDDDEGC